MMDAALAGQGVALASSVLAADDIEAGRLVKPFDLSMHQSLATTSWVRRRRRTSR